MPGGAVILVTRICIVTITVSTPRFFEAVAVKLTAELSKVPSNGGPDISNNVGPVKAWLSAVLRSLRRVF
jgi:hypothetical protein